MPSLVQRDAISEAVTIWTDAGLPYGDECEEQRPTIRVAIMEPLTFCRWYGVKCTPEVAPRAYFRYINSTPIVFLNSTIPERHYRLTMHETTHWLGVCGGIGPDGFHRDERRWAWEGGR